MTDTIEDIYESLANALDVIEPEQTILFLSKLALVMGNQLGEAELVRKCIDIARDDLKFSLEGALEHQE